MNHERRSQPQVTLEDLLRLKRAERPPAEFWTQFDRDMRIKQLAAIVEPRPWWAPLIRVGSRVSRYQLPVGATAILALTLVTVSEYRLPQNEATFVPAVAQTTLDAMPGPALSAPVAANAADQVAADAVTAETSVGSVVTEQRTLDALPGQIAQAVSQPQSAENADSRRNEFSASARSIEANLAAVKANEPELARLMDSMPGIQNRSVATNRAPAVDPLAHMQSPSDSRRARLLASVLPTSTYSSDRRTTARVDRDLTDERLYESVSRFGVQGSKLAIKF
jgi:hypothetical protein